MNILKETINEHLLGDITNIILKYSKCEKCKKTDCASFENKYCACGKDVYKCLKVCFTCRKCNTCKIKYYENNGMQGGREICDICYYSKKISDISNQISILEKSNKDVFYKNISYNIYRKEIMSEYDSNQIIFTYKKKYNTLIDKYNSLCENE
jgi:hypothetical protein